MFQSRWLHRHVPPLVFHQPSRKSKADSGNHQGDGYINKMLSQIKLYLRRLYDYARRHPVKLLMMILPLLTGGALAGILANFGIRLPRGIEGMMGGKGGPGGSSMGGMGGGGVEGMMKMAKMFM